jgi:asparagine synthetase A
MNQSRKQKTLTVTEIEKDFIINNHKHLLIREIARQLSMGIGKCYQNMMLLGLVKTTKVQQMGTGAEVADGLFDSESFFSQYKY